MLETQVLRTGEPAAGAPVVILMHGRGADPSDLAALRRFFPDDAVLVLARAPFEAARWGYGPGWAWYRYEGEDRVEEESFRQSQSELGSLVDGLEGVLGMPPGLIFVGGFSQGGTMSLGYALRTPGRLAGVINFSGFVPSHPDVVIGDAGGTPIFWGHGTSDPAIPFHMATSGRARLQAAGATLEAHDYAMGHGIGTDELRDVVRWMQQVIADEGAGAG